MGKGDIVRTVGRIPAGVWPAVLTFLLSLLWICAVAPLRAPDEPAHLQTLMEVRSGRLLPEVHWRFTPAGAQMVGAPGNVATRAYARNRAVVTPDLLVPYETSQPPLYYWVAGTVARLFPPYPSVVLYVGRVVAALFGALTVFFCWAAVCQLAPGRPAWALGAAGFLAILPQFCFNSATAANDSAANCFAALAFYFAFRICRDPAYDPWCLRLGAAVALAILSKLTGVALLPHLGLVILFRAGPIAPSWTQAVRRVGVQVVGAGAMLVLICGPWIVRNLLVYGEPSGTRDAFQFYIGKYPLLDLANDISRNWFLTLTWESFWGLFGWMFVRVPDPFYLQAQFFAGAALLLSAIAFGRAAWSNRAAWARMAQGVTLVLAPLLLLIGLYLQFSYQVAAQPQGRYLFVALVPIVLLLTGGLYDLAPGRWGKRLAMIAPLLWLGLLNGFGLAAMSSIYVRINDFQLGPPPAMPSRIEVLAEIEPIFGLLPIPPPPDYRFADVPLSRRDVIVAETAGHFGLVSGVPCGSAALPCDSANRPWLQPDAPIHRQEFAALVMAAARWPAHVSARPTFADVPADSPFYAAIETLAAHGLLVGDPCGSVDAPCDSAARPYFHPDQVITLRDLEALADYANATADLAAPP